MKKTDYLNIKGIPAPSVPTGDAPGLRNGVNGSNSVPNGGTGVTGMMLGLTEIVKAICTSPRTAAEAATLAKSEYEAKDRGNAAARRRLRKSLRDRWAGPTSRVNQLLDQLTCELTKVPYWADKAGPHTVWQAWLVLASAMALLYVDWANAAGWVENATQSVFKSFLYTVPIPMVPLATKALMDMATGAWPGRIRALLNTLFATSALAYLVTLAINYGGGGSGELEHLGAIIAGRDMRVQIVSQLLVGITGATLLFLWYQRLAAGISTTSTDPRRQVVLSDINEIEKQVDQAEEILRELERQDEEFKTGGKERTANAEAATRHEAWQRRFMACLAQAAQAAEGAPIANNGHSHVPLPEHNMPRRARGKGSIVAALGLMALLTASAFSAPTAGSNEFVVGLSPHYASKTERAATQERLMWFLLRDAPPGSTVAIFDAWHLTEIARVEVPALRFEAAEARAKIMRAGLLKLNRWFEQPSREQAPSDPLLVGAIKTPEFLEFVARLPKAGGTRTIVLLGSPFYVSETDPQTHLRQWEKLDP